LARPPRVDLIASVQELDERIFGAAESLAGAMASRVSTSLSLSEVHLLTTRSQLLRAMMSTHRSIRRLTSAEEGELDLTVDALTLTRTQLERCFLALLLEDNPPRWHARYRKNAWKALAEKFFRDQRMLGHHEAYQDYFGSGGEGVRGLRAFAREMDVSEDEFQTLRSQVLQEKEQDPRWEQWFIADMPTPGRCLAELGDPKRKMLAGVLYHHYDNLSHFSHGGMMGVMAAELLRAPNGAAESSGFDRDRFWSSAVGELTLPLSYTAVAFVTTLLARTTRGDEGVRRRIIDAWKPYLCDGVPLGVALWDMWAGAALGEASQAGDARG
jgi:hypothetical protein